jgi:UDP-glucose 4-epimerase
MKALVTGGAGFIGSNLVDYLVNLSLFEEIIVIDNLSTGKIENLNPKVTFINEDITKLDKIEEYFKNIDYVWHFAALPRVEPSIKNPVFFNNVNLNGTLNIFEASRKHGVKKIIFSSSSSVYGEPEEVPTSENCTLHPLSPYALQKLHGEQYAKLYCELYGMNIVCLRYFNVYGNREPVEGSYVPVIGIWLRQFKEKKKITLTNQGRQNRDFVNVSDVVFANYYTAFNAESGYSVYNVGSGRSYNLGYIASLFYSSKEAIDHIGERKEPMNTLADITKINKLSNDYYKNAKDVVEYIKEKMKEYENNN